MPKLTNPKTYALVSGLILFVLGVIGFAFRNSFDIPDKYLILNLILGLWGIVAAFA